MSKQVKRLSLCILYAQLFDADEVFDAGKKIWPHHNWLGITTYQDGLCLMTQNHGKDITVSKAIKILKNSLPERLQDIHHTVSMDNHGLTVTNFLRQSGILRMAGQKRLSPDPVFVDEGNIPDNYVHQPALESKKQVEKFIRNNILSDVLENVEKHIYLKDHQENPEKHNKLDIEAQLKCSECYRILYDQNIAEENW